MKIFRVHGRSRALERSRLPPAQSWVALIQDRRAGTSEQGHVGRAWAAHTSSKNGLQVHWGISHVVCKSPGPGGIPVIILI